MNLTAIVCTSHGCCARAQLMHDDLPWCVAHWRIATAHL